jgi:hypothetical protein
VFVRFKRWILDADPFATCAAYSKIQSGGADTCGCNACKNFAASRKTVYPENVRTLFDVLGVDLQKEAEVSHFAKLDSGLHYYGGWFHAVGQITGGDETQVEMRENIYAFDLEPETNTFDIGLTSRGQLIPEPFHGQRLIQVEFTAKIPWIICEPEPA